MPIAFTCPHCGAHKNVPDQFAGQTGPCAECGQVVTIPGRSAAVAPARSSSAGMWVAIAVLAAGAIGLLACGGVILVLLLPAVQTTRSVATKDAMCRNNLKQIALALHNYHAAYGVLPAPYIPDAQGQPMHSWRVALLPYLEQAEIYNQYNFNEPWDGPNNSRLAQMYPDLLAYRCPEDKQSGPTSPSYMAVVVPDGVFEAGKWNNFATVTDGLSNTLLVVEVTGGNTHWMAPVDLDANALTQMINTARDGTGLASNHARGVNVALADGSVITLTSTTDLQTLRRLATKSDGNPVVLPP